jgi:hypothetical protein
LLYATPATSQREERKRSAAVSRKLRLLRAHGLIQKLPHTYRYQVTEKGRPRAIAFGIGLNQSRHGPRLPLTYGSVRHEVSGRGISCRAKKRWSSLALVGKG